MAVVSFEVKHRVAKGVFYCVWIPLLIGAIAIAVGAEVGFWGWLFLQLGALFIARIVTEIVDSAAERKYQRKLQVLADRLEEEEVQNDWEELDEEEEDEEDEIVEEGKRLIEEHLEHECSDLLQQISSIGWGESIGGARELMFYKDDTRYAIEFSDHELIELKMGNDLPIKKAEQFIRGVVTSRTDE